MPSKVDELLVKHNAEVQKIRGFVDLTDEAKARRLSEAHAKYQGEFAKAKAAERERVEKKVRQTRKAVYGVPGKTTFSDAEGATLHDAYWKSWDRVTSVTENSKTHNSKEELEKLLDLAERAGALYSLPPAITGGWIWASSRSLMPTWISGMTRPSVLSATTRHSRSRGR
jgi:hypothetical protein